MTTLVCFLRGLNMTIHNRISMPDLILTFRKTGLKDPETYIQSGNVIFSKPGDINIAEIRQKIEDSLSKRFGHPLYAIMRTEEELKDAEARNPFISRPDFDPAKMAVVFLTERPSSEQLDKVADVKYPPDEFLISEKEIYLFCPNGFGKSKIYTNFFENRMKVIGTARNWKTITAILDIARKR